MERCGGALRSLLNSLVGEIKGFEEVQREEGMMKEFVEVLLSSF